MRHFLSNFSLIDLIYYAQMGIRNGKKVTTRNVKRFGKHSELLKITDDPLAYAREEIRKINEEYRVGRLDSYYEKPDFCYQHILRFMNCIDCICTLRNFSIAVREAQMKPSLDISCVSCYKT